MVMGKLRLANKSVGKKLISWAAALFLLAGSCVVLTDVQPALAGPCPTGWTFYAPNCQKSYTYTGSAQSFTVPPVGVTSITISARGASGGFPGYNGAGGYAEGALDVTQVKLSASTLATRVASQPLPVVGTAVVPV